MSDKNTRLTRLATFRQLQVFECIARHGSFTRAAEELHLAQPTVSAQIKKLSEALDVTLFEQIGRKVYLTEAGEVLLQGAQSILASLDATEDRINHLKGFTGGSLHMAVISTAQYFMPGVIQRFTERFPDVDISLRVENKEQLIRRMLDNRDDFYLLGQPPEGLNVEASRLVINPLFFVANSKNPLAGQSLQLDDLAEETFLMRESGSGMRAHIEKVFAEKGFAPRKILVLGGNEVIRLGLLNNMGIAISSLPTLRQELDKGEISLLSVAGFPIIRYWYLSYPRGKVLSQVAQKFIEVIREESVTLSRDAKEAGCFVPD